MKTTLSWAFFTFVILFSLVVKIGFTSEELTLTAPEIMCPQAEKIKVYGYEIVPGDNEIRVHMAWCEADGTEIVRGVIAVLDGQDWTDIMGHTITSGDVGKVLGPALKSIIWNKIEAKYNISFQ